MKVVSDENNSSDESKSSIFHQAVGYDDDVKSQLVLGPEELLS